jgi:YVTN family beta-propeller protein
MNGFDERQGDRRRTCGRPRDGRAVRRAACLALLASGLAACAPAASRTEGAAASASSDAVVATIPLGDFGTSIALTPDGSRAYVAATAKIFVLDTASRTLAATITTGDMPYQLALSRDGTRGYAVDLLQQVVWFLDLATNAVVRRVDLGEPRRPVLRPGIAVSPDGATVYATLSQPEGQGFDLLFTIDAATGAKRQHALGFHPGQLAAAPAGSLLWISGCVGLCADGTLHGVTPSDPGSAAQIPLASVPGGMALSPDGSRAYVANALAGTVAVVDLAQRTVVANVPVGAEPLGIAPSPDGTRVYVTSFQSNTLSAIDAATNRVVASVRLGKTPRAIALAPDGRFAWITHSTPEVSVVDLSRLS